MPLKRPAPGPQGGRDAKKPRTASANKVEDDVEYETVQITCSLLERFNQYPKALRQVVEEEYTDVLYSIAQAYQKGVPVPEDFVYHIVRGVKGSATSDYKLANVKLFPTASMANVAIIEEFSNLLTTEKKINFVRAPEVTVSNPAFALLHSVPPGCIGWGFDRYGCLSLHKTSVEQNKLRHDWIYVERIDYKVVKREVPDDDECMEVDAPNVKKE